jgi:hypothetical protein
MARTTATHRKPLRFDDSQQTVIDIFSARWTETFTGTGGTWSLDTVDQYKGCNTVKLITAGTGLGSRDYATKTLTTPISLNFDKHMVFELIAKVNSIHAITRFYVDLYISSSAYYEIQFESTGNKYGLDDEYEVFRASLCGWMNSNLSAAYIRSIRLQVSDCGRPITVNFAELSVYEMPRRAYICFTNDDANKSGYDFFHTVLQPAGITGTLFLSYENVVSGQGGDTNYMNHTDVLQLETDGFEVGIHGTNGTVIITASTISFDSATKQIRDSGSGFVAAGFKAGQIIFVSSGSTKNIGKYNIVTITAGDITVSESLQDEVAGASVIISANGFSEYSGITELREYLDTQITYFRDTVGVESDLKICAYPGGEYGKDETSYPYILCQEIFSACRGTTQNTQSLIPNDLYRINVGKAMYLSNVYTLAQVQAAINNLISIGGIGIIVSHDIKALASSATNWNLTDATDLVTFISAKIAAGQLAAIKFSDIIDLDI